MEINKMDWGFLQPLKELWPQQLPEFLDKIDWEALFHNPYFIGLAVIVLAYALYKRMYKFLALVFCSSASIMPHTMSQPAAEILFLLKILLPLSAYLLL